mmetsp:Transcript_86346/g.279586  ORF Transcript_86346/g.279586 Transcript_86346/m.279586 type:complete len:258 (+) Transcript_86346:205-978(+)
MNALRTCWLSGLRTRCHARRPVGQDRSDVPADASALVGRGTHVPQHQPGEEKADRCHAQAGSVASVIVGLRVPGAVTAERQDRPDQGRSQSAAEEAANAPDPHEARGLLARRQRVEGKGCVHRKVDTVRSAQEAADHVDVGHSADEAIGHVPQGQHGASCVDEGLPHAANAVGEQACGEGSGRGAELPKDGGPDDGRLGVRHADDVLEVVLEEGLHGDAEVVECAAPEDDTEVRVLDRVDVVRPHHVFPLQRRGQPG